MKSNKKYSFLVPLLFSVQPIIGLYAHNLDETPLQSILRPLVMSVVATLVLLVVARWVLKDSCKAAVLVSTLLIMFYSCGHFFNLMRSVVVCNYCVGRTMVLFPIWTILLLLLMFLIVRTRRSLETSANAMGVAVGAMIAMSLVQIGVHSLSVDQGFTPHWLSYIAGQHREWEHKPDAKRTVSPNIYYFILDNYSRSDVLAKDYKYNNSSFENYLRKRGFFVASESRTNYPGTICSLPSSLNYGFLDSLAKSARMPPLTNRGLLTMLGHTRVSEFLKSRGYKFVYIPSGYGYEWSYPLNSDAILKRSIISLTEFDRVLFDRTMMRVFRAGFKSLSKDVSYALDQLDSDYVVGGNQPMFVFAHITVTHSPFLFDSQGKLLAQPLLVKSALTRQEYERLYATQVEYLNKRMEKTVDRIIARSKVPPVIILQADHGQQGSIKGKGALTPQEKAPIMNAYYLPNGGDRALYPSISPVNSFRVVFNHYFGTSYKLLDDITYSYKYKGDNLVLTPIIRSKPAPPRSPNTIGKSN